MNPIQTWNFFQSSNRKIFLLSFKIQNILPQLDNLQKIQPQLNVLNERRKIIQNEIISLAKTAEYCRNCPASCCWLNDWSNCNHYSSIDYVMRLFSKKPIREFWEVQKQPSFVVFVLKTIKRVLQKNPISIHCRNVKCPNLTDKGCEFLAEDRPIICVVYTCPRLRHALPEDDLLKMGVLTKELILLSAELKGLLINLQ
jgi:hypothetical protein